MIKQDIITIIVKTGKVANYYASKIGRQIQVGESIEIPISLLPLSSHMLITATCDICGDDKEMMYKTYIHCTKGNTVPYHCSKHTSIRYKETMKQKYGVENGFQSSIIKEKSKMTHLQNYGVEYTAQRQDFKDKYLLGQNNYFAKKEKHKNYYYDNSSELKKWREAVYQKGKYKCCICGKGRDSQTKIHAHHLWGYYEYPEKKYDIENGVVLCVKHHNQFHWQYQNKEITPELFYHFVEGQTTIPQGSTAEDELPLEVHCIPIKG